MAISCYGESRVSPSGSHLPSLGTRDISLIAKNRAPLRSYALSRLSRFFINPRRVYYAAGRPDVMRCDILSTALDASSKRCSQSDYTPPVHIHVPCTVLGLHGASARDPLRPWRLHLPQSNRAMIEADRREKNEETRLRSRVKSTDAKVDCPKLTE